MRRYFITATGTEIGKTFATCALIHAARAQHLPVKAYKPILSGFDAQHPESSDVGEILQALGHDPRDRATLDAISPWRFAAPLSPDMAAEAEGKTIDTEALIAWSRERMASPHLTLIEGVGGAMVPLHATFTVRDWIAALAVPVILVTGSYLGSISHTLTTLEALRAAHIPIAALIVNESATSTVPLADTFATLRRFTGDIPLHTLQARVSSPATASSIHALLASLS